MTTEPEACPYCSEPATGDVRFLRDGRIAHVECAEVRVFVYGTLRTGGALERRLKAAWREPATLDGGSLYVGRHGAFPVLIVGGGLGTVRGELLAIARDDEQAMAQWKGTARMERQAGYRTTTRTVHSKSGDVRAKVFVYEHSVGGMTLIEDGDWMRFERLGPTTTGGAVACSNAIVPDQSTVFVRRRDGVMYVHATPDGSDAALIETPSYTDLGRWCREHGVRTEFV